ncbi:transposase [Thiohalobacter sp. COW1]|uniref:REP-associated tyrosine transposase n=1 Tax=Thiohalobacter sp. COW1 TaxID=2795687 RepID=UPI0019165404|nr:transposase [Thiohalobacter sp. COW1]BCO30501.1 transposase [Thiohalobacter sp. COW1]
MNYRRNFVAGGCFFFTLVTAGRRPILTRMNSVAVLREAFRSVRARYPFRMDAVVILPDHLHCIWTLPEGDADFATRWRLIKTGFTRHCDPLLRGMASQRQAKRGEGGVWQHRYWEHTLRDADDYVRHVEYIHYNPVKHGYVGSAADWAWSSFHRYVGMGAYPPDWGGGCVDFEGVGRE